MKKSLSFLINILGLILICSACQNNKFDDQLLLGSWSVDSWKIEATGKSITNKMDMKFEAGDKYSIDYGSQTEAGKYWVAGEYLHTVATEKSEKRVKILKLQSDKMHIQMNRSGQIENVVLSKN